jgi:hypothetical protein
MTALPSNTESSCTPLDLAGQFVLCKDKGAVPEGWPVRQCGEWRLGSHPSLPVIDVVASDGVAIGWLLGWAIGREGALASGKVQFPLSSDAVDAGERFESSLYEYGGRFAAVCLAGPRPRFYLDACGSLAAVYCKQQQIVASTPALVPASGDEDPELVRAVMVPGFDCWYPFGLTPRRGVTRLLPDHFLDLRTWECVRHWPAGEIAVERDTQSAVREFAELVKRNIRAVAQLGPFHACLTGGRDSRMMLACSREVLKDCKLFTIAMPTESGTTDRQITRKMARRFHLDHVLLPLAVPTAQEEQRFAYRVGQCVGGLISPMLGSFQRLDPQRPVLWGQAGELGRGFHWRSGDTESSPVSDADVVQHLSRLLHPLHHQEVLARAGQWLASLPVSSALAKWGLLYQEQYNGCYQGPLMYGNAHNVFGMWPLCHRRAIEIMLALPADYRRRLAFEEDVIASQWPELLAYPFNWPMGVRKCAFYVGRRVRSMWNRMFPRGRGRSSAA